MEYTAFLKWLCYLAAISFGSFLIGRCFPYRWFDESRFPFRTAAWEQGGKFYVRLGVPKWQNRVPDMSRIFSFLMPAKAMTDRTPEGLQTMITETCIAEFVHGALSLLGLGALAFWHSGWGLFCTALYVLGNIPFVLIQRYNRPRLLKLKEMTLRRQARRQSLRTEQEGT